MRLGRIFANALARRLAYVIVAALLAWLGIGKARAADEGQAYAQCNSERSEYPGSSCYKDAGWQGNIVLGQGVGIGHYRLYPYDVLCSARPSDTSSPTHTIVSGMTNGTGTFACNSGCTTRYDQAEDGQFVGIAIGGTCSNDELEQDCPSLGPNYYWDSTAGACRRAAPECPEGESKQNGVCKRDETCPEGQFTNADGECEVKADTCPAGQVKSPEGSCLPGDGQCAAGEVRKKDGTCGKDGDGDGTADDDESDTDEDGKKKSQFSGGDSCDSPPSCAGDAIMCGQARIQWRIDCNTRNDANISGGACGAVPICTGKNCKAMEYAQLLQQYRAACALDKLANGGGEGGDGNIKDIRDAVMAHGDFGEEGSPEGAFAAGEGNGGGNGAGGEAGELDMTGFGWSSSCPTIPAVSVMGQTINFNTSLFCNWAKLGGQFVLVIASLLSLRILSAGTEV